MLGEARWYNRFVPERWTGSTRGIDLARVIEDAHAGDLALVFAEEPPVYDFSGTIERLFSLLDARRLDFVLVGGLALLNYIEGRNTRDIDLVMAPGDVDHLPELEIATQDRDFVNATFEGIGVDILKTSNRLFAEFRQRFVTAGQFADRQIQTATPEGLVFLKLFALPSVYRRGQQGKAAIFETDILVILSEYEIDTEGLLSLLAVEMLPTDIAALAEVVGEIRGRIARAGERFPGSPAGELPA